MNPEDNDVLEERLSALLAAYDDALAAGRPPPPDDDFPPDLRTRLERARACLRRLDAERRAAPGGSPPPPQPGPSLSWVAGPLEAEFGRFRIERELGRGGSGVVFLAFDPVLSRRVALKVPRLEALMTAELRGRFLREARAAARLDHPGLVPV